jgi:hypothetical protein
VELLALYGDSAGQIGLDGARSGHTRPMQVANHTCSVYPDQPVIQRELLVEENDAFSIFICYSLLGKAPTTFRIASLFHPLFFVPFSLVNFLLKAKDGSPREPKRRWAAIETGAAKASELRATEGNAAGSRRATHDEGNAENLRVHRL